MSEEQKDGIVVNPFHKGVAAPQGDTAGNEQALSEQSSGDAAQSPPPSSDSQQPPQGDSPSPSNPTDTSATTASDASSTSQPDSPAEGQSLIQKIEGALGTVIEKVEGKVERLVEDAQDLRCFVEGDVLPALEQSFSSHDTSPAQADLTARAPLAAGAALVTGIIVPGSVMTPVAAVSPVAPDAPVAAVKKEESVVLDTIQTGVSDVDQIVDRLMKGCGIEAKLIINTIEEYIVAMKPGKLLAQKEAVKQQVSFYNAIISAINNLEADFRPTMQSILALLHAHKDGAFKETHVFRYIESVPLSTENRAGWRKLTTLLKTLANPATRQDLLRQINFDPLVKHGLTERGRTKLAAFFGK